MKLIKRTTVGLMDALFDEFDNLVNGKSAPQCANAKVALAKAIVSTKKLEMDYARFISREVGEIRLGK